MIDTATVQTLAAEVHVLTLGSRQITLSVARQLDRIDGECYGPGAITPFGRVKTGATMELCRRLPSRPRKVIPAKHETYDGVTWYENYTATPWLEVIGRSELPENNGALVIYQIGSYADFRELYGTDDDKADLDTVDAWQKLPLIVLAGLR